jgi:hypothetical protein
MVVQIEPDLTLDQCIDQQSDQCLWQEMGADQEVLAHFATE